MPEIFLLALAGFSDFVVPALVAGFATGVLVSAVFMVLSGFSGTLTGATSASGFGFRGVGFALVLIGATALSLTGGAATFARVGVGVDFAFDTSFAGAAALAAGFLGLLATGLLTGFLAAVATIDSSVGDTALKN